MHYPALFGYCVGGKVLGFPTSWLVACAPPPTLSAPPPMLFCKLVCQFLVRLLSTSILLAAVIFFGCSCEIYTHYIQQLAACSRHFDPHPTSVPTLPLHCQHCASNLKLAEHIAATVIIYDLHGPMDIVDMQWVGVCRYDICSKNIKEHVIVR